jgi:ribose 5-phosphate isomerase A
MPTSVPPTPARAASPAQLEELGRRAAQMIQPQQRVGLGSGRAALAFVRELGRRIQSEQLTVVAVATSLATEHAARSHGVPLSTLAETPELDIAIDGADEVDPELNLTKGGGGHLTREKVVASCARRLVIVVGEEKIVEHLGTHFPVFVEVIEFARTTVRRKLEALGAVVTQRMNADGTAFLTDNHNPYLHCRFGPPPHHLADPAQLELTLDEIPGLVETGLFVHMADEVLIANVDGTITHRQRK